MAMGSETVARSPVVRVLASGLTWWLRELRQVSRDLSAYIPDKRQTTPVVLLSTDLAEPGGMDAKDANALKTDLSDEAWASLHAKLAANGRSAEPVSLRIADALCLVKRGDYPRVSDHDLKAIIDLEVTTTTPFSSANAFWTWRRPPASTSQTQVETVIVKKDLIDRIEVLAAASGITLQGISPATKEDTPQRPFKIYETAASRAKNLWRKVNLVLAGLLVVGCGVVYTWTYLEKAAALDAIEADIRAKTKVAKALRQEQTRQEEAAHAAAEIAKLKNAQTSVVEAWARITGLLPKSAWLSEMTLSRDDGTLVGFTTNAASLIELLEQDSAFKDVQFATPVRIDPLSKAERFDIRFKREGIE